MSLQTFACLLLLITCSVDPCWALSKLPIVINTWPFVDANKEAVSTLTGNGGGYLDALEKGCSTCEMEQCDGSVGFGGSPDENGETTLDAMIMDGETHSVGAVGCLREVKNAISVARSVMEHTMHTFLVGDQATSFAMEMGFQREDLHTEKSRNMYNGWKNDNCQPNYWTPKTVKPDPKSTCGPYQPNPGNDRMEKYANPGKDRMEKYARPLIDRSNHDTIGMIIVDSEGKIGCGTSTNGANHKIPGRVGDSPVAGAGCYVERGVGGAATTGDGDIMMRFLPARFTVDLMKQGKSPTAAAEEAISEIKVYYPSFVGALIAVNVSGDHGAAYNGLSSFHYTVYNPILGTSTVVAV